MDFWRDTGGGDHGYGGSHVPAIPNVVDCVDGNTAARKSVLSLNVRDRAFGKRLVSLELLRNRFWDKCFSVYSGVVALRETPKTKLSLCPESKQ